MSPIETKGKRESGTARVLGSGASGKSSLALGELVTDKPRYRRVDGLPPRRMHISLLAMATKLT